jgi:Holliday junction resolvasome RuvABC endonuclease subunit
MTAGGLLALDIATKTGWCYGRVPLRGATAIEAASSPPARPESGVLRVMTEAGGVGHFLAEFHFRLTRLLYDKRPAGLIIEAPLMPKMTSYETVRKLMSMAGIAEMLADQRGIRWRAVAQPASVKKHWTGKGNAKKDDMIAACRQRGWWVADDNEADALAIWDLGCHLYRKEMGK